MTATYRVATHRQGWGIVAAITALCAVTACSSTTTREERTSFTLQPSPVVAPASRPWFNSGSAFWEPIPANPTLAPNNADLQALLADPEANMVANLVSFAVPIVEWSITATPVPLTVLETGHDGWGYNELSSVASVQLPIDAAAAAGSDGKLVIIDRNNNRVLDLLAAARTDTGWNAKWGGVYPLNGDGTSPTPAYQGPNAQVYPEPVSRGTGSGISSLAGLVTVDDIASGTINHALVFATDRACGPPFTGTFWPPATTTDGWVEDGPCLAEGARIQLDPAVNVDLLGLDPGRAMIAKALQRFGAYCIDNGGSRLGFIFELAPPERVSVYEQAGLVGDYASLTDLPWGSVRLLAPTIAATTELSDAPAAP
jgi:hypothetical protein